MKKLMLIATVVAATTLFADRTANQGWVAQQITNAVEYVEGGYQAADTLLNGSISGEATTRSSNDTILGNRIAQAEQNATNLFNTVSGNVTAEASARAAADDLLTAGQESLSTRVTQVAQSATNLFNSVSAAVADESSARSSAITTVMGSVSSEATARSNADTALGNRIAQAEQNATNLFNTVSAAVSAESTARANAISAEETARVNAISAESTARANAISAESTARETAVNNEALARSSADTAINSRIDTITNIIATTSATLQQSINDEANARATNDELIQNNITSSVNALVPGLVDNALKWNNVTNNATLKFVRGVNIVPIAEGAELTADMTGWDDGQTVFTRIVPAGTYTVGANIYLAGYGIFPTSEADCVVWRSKNKLFVTVLREE